MSTDQHVADEQKSVAESATATPRLTDAQRQALVEVHEDVIE